MKWCIFRSDWGGVKLWGRQSAPYSGDILEFENGLKASVKAHPKSLQLRALRDTPAKAPENVWGDFPKSNSTKSSQKYQNILWTKDAAILCKHFLSLWQLKLKEKFCQFFQRKRVELWIEIDMTSTLKGEKSGIVKKWKGLLNAATAVKWSMMRGENKKSNQKHFFFKSE